MVTFEITGNVLDPYIPEIQHDWVDILAAPEHSPQLLGQTAGSPRLRRVVDQDLLM